MIVPYVDSEEKKRMIGILDGKAKVTFAEDFNVTEEEFLGLK